LIWQRLRRARTGYRSAITEVALVGTEIATQPEGSEKTGDPLWLIVSSGGTATLHWCRRSRMNSTSRTQDSSCGSAKERNPDRSLRRGAPSWRSVAALDRTGLKR